MNEIFCELLESQVRYLVLSLNKLLQMDSGGVIAMYGSSLDVYTDMAFFLLDEHIQPFDKHTASLHAPLKLLFHIGCIKWATFGK